MGRPILRWLPVFVIIATILYTMSVYASLPAMMPTHWGVSGRANGWSPREFGAWLLPGIMVLELGLFRLLPKIDPKKANYAKFGVAYDLTIATAVTFMGVVQWAMLNVALGRGVDLNTVVYVGFGAMFVILGFALPAARQNWFFGIRTPWTLSDEGVWARTHKVGGLLMALAGAATIAAALTTPPTTTFVIMLTATLSSGVLTVLLSYLYWRNR